MKTLLLIIQAFTYIPLGVFLWAEGQWKLAVAQWLLAGVTVLVYS